MKTALVLVCLFLGGAAMAAIDTPMKPIRVQEVSLRNVPLNEGERIAAVEVEVSGASFSAVRVPIDWGFDVGAPVSGIAVLKGEAAHGVGMPFTTMEFQRFLTLALYDYGQFSAPFTIKAKLTLYRYDKKAGESERTIEVPTDSIVLEEPRPPNPTAAAIGVAFRVHGRLWIQPNGTPNWRIWVVGSKRILGVPENAHIPIGLRQSLPLDHFLFADFVVKPLTIDEPGVMRMVEIESAENSVITDMDLNYVGRINQKLEDASNP